MKTRNYCCQTFCIMSPDHQHHIWGNRELLVSDFVLCHLIINTISEETGNYWCLTFCIMSPDHQHHIWGNRELLVSDILYYVTWSSTPYLRKQGIIGVWHFVLCHLIINTISEETGNYWCLTFCIMSPDHQHHIWGNRELLVSDILYYVTWSSTPYLR